MKVRLGLGSGWVGRGWGGGGAGEGWGRGGVGTLCGVCYTCLGDLGAELYLLVESRLLGGLLAGVQGQGVHGVRGGGGEARVAQAGGHRREGQGLGGEHGGEHLY